MKNIATSLLILILLSIGVFAQPARRTGPPIVRGPAPAPKVKVVAVDDPLNDFAKKGLPRAYVFGGDPDAALAKKAAAIIRNDDTNSLSALIGALLVAGFHIIDQDQKILFKPAHPNGTAFFDYEVAGMLRSSNLGIVSSLEKFGKVVKGDSAILKNIDIAGDMVRDIKAARTSKSEQNKFLAELILALGNDIQTPQSTINMMQMSLIERRYLGDLATAYEEASGGLSFFERSQRPGDLAVAFANVSYDRVGMILGHRSPMADDSPCPTIDTAAEAQGYKKKGEKILKMFGVQHPGKGAFGEYFKDAAKGVELANTITSYLKLIAANLFIEIEVDVPNAPLVRTKSNQLIDRGEERIVTATFKRYFPNSAQINCVAKVIKMATGAELDVPEEGVLKDVPVKWEPLDRAEDAPLYVDALDRGDVSKQKTDDAGQNKIKATGKEQRKDLRKIAVAPVPKKDRWRVSVATEKMDAEKDIPKILWGSLDLKNGGILGYLIGVVPDVLAKMALKTVRVDIPVKDWEPCTADWSGTVSYTRDLRKTTVVKSSRTPGMNSAGDGVKTVDIHEDVEITLNPRTPEEVAAGAPTKPATFDVYGYYITKFEGIRENDPCCGKEAGKFTTSFVSGTDITFEKPTFPNSFGITFSGGDSDYSLGFGFGTGPVPSKVHDYERVDETTCNLEKGHDENSESTAWVQSTLAPGRYPAMYLSDGVQLVGSKTLQDSDGSTITWQWEISRCSIKQGSR
ncbi:MAG: hypothetical protein DCC44_11815 [Acidobacteria bacterium]|nr:MAG: hypothetical protein DCC44_11815 [Acidobacteriota bacterium]